MSTTNEPMMPGPMMPGPTIPGVGAPVSVWDTVIGQERAVEILTSALAAPVHAYLFVGPSGVGKLAAARAFASQLLTHRDDPTERTVDLVLRGEHPDVTEVERTGASISADQAREVVRASVLAPVEGSRKVMILKEFHRLSPEGAAILLKTIEEPPESTTILILADFMPADLITISSRCARIEFRALSGEVIERVLAAEGTPADRVAEVAAAAAGSLERARVLARDPDLAARRDAFAAVPRSVDGTGATASRLADELLAMVDDAAASIEQRHAEEVAALQERIEQYGQRGSGKKQLEERHKRELRRHRTDELLAGLAAIAGVYRDAIVAGTTPIADGAATVERLHEVMQHFEVNINERLTLVSVLWGLPPLDG